MSKLTKKDFESGQEVRWCPGCGDYAVLASMQKTLAQLNIPKEDLVFISGIGCASRFPYYLDTYGFHTIHGRAPAVATGLKLMRPELSVWVITGDGDGLSIGLSHLVHLMRRNVNVKVLLFNNQIYGLTKGQFSPTSHQGSISASSPTGSVDLPLKPLSVALAADCSFVARGIDVDGKGLEEIFTAAAKHTGTAFVEILQNCPVYNDGVFSNYTDKKIRADRTIWLQADAPLRFGKNLEKVVSLSNYQPQVKDFSAMSLHEKKALYHHDVTIEQSWLPTVLADLAYPDFPVAMGIFRAIERDIYNQRSDVEFDLEKVLEGSQVWEV